MPKTQKSETTETKHEAEKPKISPPKAVKAVFVPVGSIKVNLETPSGNEYHIVPCEKFTIKGEDVDWFFTTWDWSFRQRLLLAADYHPTCGYHDPKVGEKDYQPNSNYDPTPTKPAKPIDSPTAIVVETNSEDKE